MASIEDLFPAQQQQDAANLAALMPRPDIPELQNSHGGSFVSGLINAMGSALTAPGDAYTGRMAVRDPQSGHVSDETIARGTDLAGLAMTGGVGGAGEGAVVGSGPIRAYHGSPHDFDAFDLSKIGTGEGAQVYGHGLYFAENPAVAAEYRNQLSGDPAMWKVGGEPYDMNNPLHVAAQQVYTHGGRANALAALDAGIENGARYSAPEWLASDPAYQRALKDRELLAGDQPVPEMIKGRMYEVGIHADPNAFLPWDETLTQYGTRVPYNPDLVDRLRSVVQPDQRRAFDHYMRVGGTGENIYKDVLGGDVRYRLPQITQQLNEAGIPGIKYLDQGSRAVGEGTSNYVVFNPQIVEIMRKYGVASVAALPPAVQLSLGLKPSQPDAPQQ